MRPSWLPVPLVLLVSATALISCSSGSDSSPSDTTSPEGEAAAVPEGKADNYLSPTSMEYDLTGQGSLTLEGAWTSKTDAEKEAHVRELLGFRFKAYAYFINEYVTNKEGEEANASYGGFSGYVRGSSIDTLLDAADASKNTWTFLWSLQMGAPRDLLSKLPIQKRSTGEKYFVVKMPKLTEAQLLASNYPKDFDPSKYQGPMEDIEVEVSGAKESTDAYPEYSRLFEDGKLDIMIVVGGDYNAERYDLKTAEAIFSWLKSAGYKHPAASFKDLTLDSPPFTSSLKANGKDIPIEITFYHPDVVQDADLPKLRDKIVEGYQSRDIVIYDGHAGEDPGYSGVVYHYNPRAAISANELAQLALPAKYQIYLFNGCKTYAAYPEALYKSPTKTTENLDIISTVNFAWLSMMPFTTSGFISQLTAKRSGTHDPMTYMEILREINRSNNANVYYGVHGVDDNPHGNPYMDSAALCRSCSVDSDCPGMGNKCVKITSGKVCGGECTADDGCPDGYKCTKIAVGSQITGAQCLPKTFSCR